MLNEDRGKAIADAFKRRDPTRNAIVQSVTNGEYTLTYVDTGGSVKARAAQPSDTYAVGKVVVVRHDASGRSMGRPPVILGYSQSSANGAIVGTLSYESPLSAGVITGLPPVAGRRRTRAGRHLRGAIDGDGDVSARRHHGLRSAERELRGGALDRPPG
jgi:hypothetical protein